MNSNHCTTPGFDYDQAFSRNIGWLTEWEQPALRGKSVAIAGMGGVGGVHLLTLVRLGIGAFRLADFDTFDIVNFNRQAGATTSALGQPKLDVMAEMALAINPTLDITRFPDGVVADGIDAFLHGADLFVDGFDFFALDIRRKVFARCAELGIPAVTAAPIGMGVGWLSFVPGGMTFEEYFRLEGQPKNEQLLRFLMGVAPRGLHRAYLVDPSRIDLEAGKGPSTAAACQLCSGVIGTLAVKLLLGRGDVQPAPFHHHFDAYANAYRRTRLPQGNATPTQRLRLAVARRHLLKPVPKPPAPAAPAAPATPLEQILEAARWAPSGDNSQPWRFQRLDADAVRIHLTSETAVNPYDYRRGEPSLLSGGMLLESLRLAATRLGRRMAWCVHRDQDPWQIDVRFTPDDDVVADPLCAALQQRSVNRRPYRTRPLTAAEKTALDLSLEHELVVAWHEPLARRLEFARMGSLATDIRLRAAETYAVHREVIDWAPGNSRTGLPAAALGLDRPTLLTMRWAMVKWPRLDRLNRLTGTWAAARQLDVAPARGCAAFFTLEGPGVAAGPDRSAALLRRGMAIQRFWLTATRLGLALQPGLAIVIFAQYGAEAFAFTQDAALRAKAGRLATDFARVLGRNPEDVTFLGRIGEPKPGLPVVRSIRRRLSDLAYAGHAA